MVMNFDEIVAWCKKYTNLTGAYSPTEAQYKNVGPGKIDVIGNFYVDGSVPLTQLPFELNRVSGTVSLPTKFTSLKGSPHSMVHPTANPGDKIKPAAYIIDEMPIGSLVGGPVEADTVSYHAERCGLKNLVGMPQKFKGWMHVYNNPIESLEGLTDIFIGELHLPYNPNLPLMPLFRNKKKMRVIFYKDSSIDKSKEAQEVSTIINQWLPTKKFMSCAAALIHAGYPQHAKL
jgi:hypothetical protein